MTGGLRWRIALGILLGLLALAIGIARFAFLGQFLARLFRAAPTAELVVPLVGTLAAILLRPWLDHMRTMVAHRTAARVQETLRRRLYDKIVALGPAWFGAERTGGVMLSIIDGVEQLQTFFGQYIPQVSIAACAPLAIFAFMAFWDVPVATVMLCAALFTLVAPVGGARAHRPGVARAAERLQGIRRGVPRRDAGPADAEGVRPERRLRADAGRQGPRAVRQHVPGPRHQHPDARHHRPRLRARRRGGAGARCVPGPPRRDEPRGAADRADGGHGDLPPAARTAHGAAPGPDRPGGGRRHQCAAG